MDKRINVNISALPSEMKAISADIINIEYSNGYVFLTFVQTYGTDDDEDADIVTRNGLVMSRVMLSWEQCARLLSDMAKFVKSTKDKAEKNSKKAFDFASNMTVTVVDNNDE